MADYSNWLNDANSFYKQAGANAMPSAASRDTAAARVRSRLQGAQGGLEQNLADTYAGKGFNQGGYQRAISQSRGNYLGQLSTGLADVEKNYEDQRMQGAQNLGNIASNMGQTATNAEQNQVQRDIGMGQLAVEDKTKSSENLLKLLQTFGEYGNILSNYGGISPDGSSPTTRFNWRMEELYKQLFPLPNSQPNSIFFPGGGFS